MAEVPHLFKIYAEGAKGITVDLLWLEIPNGTAVGNFSLFLGNYSSMSTREHQIKQLLGGSKVLGSPKNLTRLAEEGLPKQALVIFMEKINLDERRLFSYLDVSRRTIDNYKPHDRLRLYISDRLIHLAELYAKGKEIFDSFNNFHSWLNRPSVDLGGERPIDRIQTRKGIDELLHILGRIEHGVLA